MAQSISEAGIPLFINDSLADSGSELSHLSFKVSDPLLESFNLAACGEMEVLGEARPLGGSQGPESVRHLHEQS